MHLRARQLAIVTLLSALPAWAQDLTGLSKLTPGRTRAENALWIETPDAQRFHTSKTITVAEIKGPGVITMIHFAYPQLAIAKPKEYQLGRDLLLRMYWDGETEPSVDCPFVDFFCDPAGLREVVNTALVNKKRGWNAYFPMPFRISARIVLEYDGPEPPGEKLWTMMPCYSYVCWRQVEPLAGDEGYFHAQWRQASCLMGKEDYKALEATGRGKFVGWNVTLRRPGTPGYPVDMNEKFYVDGEKSPSSEFQGIEDSFGFSWGFPEAENVFPLTGYWPFKQGAAAYRFFIGDAISFEKSLRVDIGFGEREHPMFRDQFSRAGTSLHLSTTCYWYQAEPHAKFPAMPAVADRGPAPEELFWPDKPVEPDLEQLKARGVAFHMLCGRPGKQIVLAAPGFDAQLKQGHAWAGWPPPVYHALTDDNDLHIELAVPAGATGTLRLYMIDPDHFGDGRVQQVTVDDQSLGEVKAFPQGRWLEVKVTPEMSRDGRLSIHAVNRNPKGNAVISIIEWVQPR